MAPFNRKIVTPTKLTTTGWDDRLSGSGGLMAMVNTEPRLVPTHSVGISTDGSARTIAKMADRFQCTEIKKK